MFTNSLIESTREGRFDARQQLRPDDRTQLSAEMAVSDPGVRGGQSGPIGGVQAGWRLLSPPRHLLAFPKVLQPVPTEGIGDRSSAEPLYRRSGRTADCR